MRSVLQGSMNEPESSAFDILRSLFYSSWNDQSIVFFDSFLLLLEAVSSSNTHIRCCALNRLLDTPKEYLETLLPAASVWACQTPQNPVRAIKDISIIMETSVNEYLEAAFPYILPVIVAGEQSDLLNMLICRGKDVSPSKVARKLIMYSGDIVSHLLIYGPENEPLLFQYFFGLVQPYSPDSIISVQSIFRSNALQLVYNLVVELGGERRARAETAIRNVASELTPGNNVSSFLLQHSLGIISRMQDALTDVGLCKPRSLKIKIAKSAKSLVNLLGETISRIGSQFLGFFQSLLDYEFLWDVALDAWLFFTKSLSMEILDELFRQIAILLLSIESRSSVSQKKKIVYIFRYLIIDCGKNLKYHFAHLPDFPNGDEWKTITDIVHRKDGEKSLNMQLQDFDDMLSQDNMALIAQALTKLKQVLDERHADLQKLVLAEEVNEHVRTIVQKLILLINRYHTSDRNIGLLCCDCLGSIGAIDPSRMKIDFDSEHEFDANASLNAPDEILGFTCLFIEKHLVGSFKAAQDAKEQANISFTIQELLRWCGFTAEIVQEASELQSVRSRQRAKLNLVDRWRSFPVSILSTLTPLITSRYHIESLPFSEAAYPIFEPSLTYSDWIRKWYLDLMFKVPDANSLKMFELTSCMISNGDTATTKLLLPHLITIILISKSHHIDKLVQEFCHILMIKTDSAPANLIEQHRLCLQVFCRTFSLTLFR